MTKGSYIRVAHILAAAHGLIDRGYNPCIVLETIVNNLVDVLEEDNPRFSEDKFRTELKEYYNEITQPA